MSVLSRRSIDVRGLVQGVGFRPYVCNLARRHGLAGFVRNDTAGVRIEVEGEEGALERFTGEIPRSAPKRARIRTLHWTAQAARGERDFRIEESRPGEGVPAIGADVATCSACLAEILDAADRRHGHAFASCTDCGPRYTIATAAPWDRERSTMASFPMCARCRAEYEDAADRRFHAQPIACPDCGPQLALLDAAGHAQPGEPLATAAAGLLAGRIVAVKGLGGYHLACDAGNDAAVAALRARKRRDAKPFALMVADLAAVEALAELCDAERALLESPERPIVLVRNQWRQSPFIAPGLSRVGVMLPSSPLHHLLLRACEGRPLVMTSGNVSDEPMAFDDAEALARLAGIADLFLCHDRPIASRCDDSVARVAGTAPLLLRRSRGYAPSPEPLPLPLAAPTLAVGGHLKSVFALGERDTALPSHHLGDLDHPSAFDAFTRAIAQYRDLFGVAPARIVHDLHPDYATTAWAQEQARAVGPGLVGIGLIAVQHHHAHIASCMAEHGLQGAAIGVAFDGSGYGPDGTVWGGEFLCARYADFTREARLRAVPLPGLERAVREPWRMALAHALDAGLDPSALIARLRIDEGAAHAVARLCTQRPGFRSLVAPLTSSVGRLFDAVAAIAGVCTHAAFEAQAAQQLEGLAENAAPEPGYPFGCDDRELDPRPMILAACADARQGIDPARIARRFHEGLAAGLAQVCARIRERTGLTRVALSGGVFCNALLTALATRELETHGFAVFCQRRLPPNDGGLAYGQLAVAAGRDAAARTAPGVN